MATIQDLIDLAQIGEVYGVRIRGEVRIVTREQVRDYPGQVMRSVEFLAYLNGQAEQEAARRN